MRGAVTVFAVGRSLQVVEFVFSSLNMHYFHHTHPIHWCPGFNCESDVPQELTINRQQPTIKTPAERPILNVLCVLCTKTLKSQITPADPTSHTHQSNRGVFILMQPLMSEVEMKVTISCDFILCCRH